MAAQEMAETEGDKEKKGKEAGAAYLKAEATSWAPATIPTIWATWSAIVGRARRLRPQRIPLPPLTRQPAQKIPGWNPRRRGRGG